jgi:hypothetical protein
MPEGHTLHRLAALHRRRYVGRPVAVSSPQGRFVTSAELVDGRVLESVEAYGKHLFHTYYRAREACQAAESRFGLTPTGAADRAVAAAHPTRAELEKATRRGRDEPSRLWLRRAARVAAVQAQDPEQFFRRLADLGVLVRPRERHPDTSSGTPSPHDASAHRCTPAHQPDLDARFRRGHQPRHRPPRVERAGRGRAQRTAVKPSVGR